MLGVIPAKDIDRTWHLCRPLIARAMKNGDNVYTIEDIKKGLETGVFQLWTWVENLTIVCCAVTCINNYPSKRICSLMIIGGRGLKMWKESAQKIMVDWAKKNGCTEMEGYARKGWLRVLPEWRPVWTTIRRSL